MLPTELDHLATPETLFDMHAAAASVLLADTGPGSALDLSVERIVARPQA